MSRSTQIKRLETILAKIEALEAFAAPKMAERLRAAKNELIRAHQEARA